MQNLLFCAHTLCMNYVTNTLLLVSSSVRSKQLLCFVHGQGQKREQKPTTKKFVRFHNHSPLLTMIKLEVCRYFPETHVTGHFRIHICFLFKSEYECRVFVMVISSTGRGESGNCPNSFDQDCRLNLQSTNHITTSLTTRVNEQGIYRPLSKIP